MDTKAKAWSSLDAILVFGGEEKDLSRTNHAYRIYHDTKDLRKDPLRIVVSGSHPGISYPAPFKPESQIMKENLVRMGVPEDLIYVEGKALDTLGNIILSQPVIEEALADCSNRRIGLIMDNHGMKRTMWLADRIFPEHYEIYPLQTDKILPYPQRIFTYVKEKIVHNALRLDLLREGISRGDQKRFEFYLRERCSMYADLAPPSVYGLLIDFLKLINRITLIKNHVLRLISR